MNNTAYSYAHRALGDVPSHTTVRDDQERALGKADAVENLARAVMELAQRQ